jgi:predicted metal-dependent phosphoesterase TrpH
MKNIEMHCHSTLSDGRNSLEEIIAEAKRCNLDFLALTDHDHISPKSFQDTLRE